MHINSRFRLLLRLVLVFVIARPNAECHSANNTKPFLFEWIHNHQRDPSAKLNLISWIVDGCFYYDSTVNSSHKCPQYEDDPPPEFQSFDGFYNNIFKVDLGAVDTPLLRRVPPVYADGTYEPVQGNRINPFLASSELMTRSPDCRHEGETVACGSKTGKSAFLVYFGQQVVEEILDAQRPGCPPEYFNIPIPDGEAFQDFKKLHTEMPFLRSRYAQNTGHSPSNPRQQLNEITPWIDGGLIYGTSKGWADGLRTSPNPDGTGGTLHPHGQLASDNDEGLFPARNTLRLPLANPPPPANHTTFIEQHQTANVNRFYVLGNPRGNENAFLLSFGVVLFRWHNQFATYLHDSRPKWSGERVFQEARKWTIATYQQLVVYDWLNEWLAEPLAKYTGYDPSVDPQIEQFFQTAAMRFGHTLVTPGAYMRDYACAKCKPVPFAGTGGKQREDHQPSIGAVRTCNIYWRSQEPLDMKFEPNENCTDLTSSKITDIDRLLMGMSSQRAEREDNMIVDDLRGRVFGPLEFSRRDLMAINIQRGRDHGTPDYNTARESFGPKLKRITSVDEYLKETQTATPREILERMVCIHAYGYGVESYDKSSNSTCDYDTLDDETKLRAWKNIDVWTGGILETSDRPGPLFREIIKDQFTRIRNADRFWFENTKWNHPRFSSDQIARIKTLKVIDMILAVTKMHPEDIQLNPFQVPDNETNRLNCCIRKGNLEPTIWQSGDKCYRLNYSSEGLLLTNRTLECYYLPQLDSEINPVEPCTAPGKYDYFRGSELSFILTFVFLGLTVIGIVGILRVITGVTRKSRTPKDAKLTAYGNDKGSQSHYAAREWIGKKEGTRVVDLTINEELVVKVRDVRGVELREVDLKKFENEIDLIMITDEKHVVLKVHSEYDLVLQFEGPYPRQQFIGSLEERLRMGQTVLRKIELGLKETLDKNVITKSHRLAKLESFFRVVFQAAAKPEDVLNSEEAEKVINTELTKDEFADALGMTLKSTFVDRIFDLIDKDGNGYIGFLEFLMMLIVLRNGNANDKAQLLFQMYDVRRQGYLTTEEFKTMIRSMIEAASTTQVSEMKLEELVHAIIASAGLRPGSHVTLMNFLELFAKRTHGDILGYDQLNARNNRPYRDREAPTKRRTYIERIHDVAEHIYDVPYAGDERNRPTQAEIIEPDMPDDDITMETKPSRSRILLWVQIHRLELFWVTLYTLVVIAIFGERAYYYTVEREHSGLRHIAGYGVTITRGAASVMMFCYATLLLTMCRNVITSLRETFLHHYIPFDAFVLFHKYIAYIGLIFTIIHVVGHGVNFYHISTQPAEDLSCYFRDYFRPTHILPKFHYWTFGTITGLAGILLTIQAAIIYIFATNYSRMNTFRAFWLTHSSYPLWYILIVIHGSGRLIAEPLFFNFLVGPLIVFVADKLLTISGNSRAIPVIEADLLPSNVTKLKFSRPAGFGFRSGQWIRIACTKLNPSEFHPFTISSSPHEPHLTVFIRAVGPFTTNIRRIYESEKPKLYIEGPFGEGHQDWHRYDVSILIGGGIGVTPFASIMKDVVATSSVFRQCKKIYFLWVTRTQKQFEWMIDIIREVENHNMINVDVFITQHEDKYDLRTTLLYICEESFQKVNNHSIFTGLKSKTHFGRPNFYSIFKSLKDVHGNVQKFGVFSCGPSPMSKSVDEACNEINNSGGSRNSQQPSHNGPVTFEHHHENF